MDTLEKAPTGIAGFDEILEGGLPRGRPTLVSGGPGCGKTALAMEFLCHGACRFGEPGLFVSFEESAKDIETNFGLTGFGFDRALQERTLHIESILMAPDPMVEAGEFTLDGLLVRLEYALKSTGAKRLVLDSLGALFSCFSDTANLRYELSRIFRWIKEHGLTVIVTGEWEEERSNHHDFDKYLSDCVISIDHRITEQISKRRLRVVKYRGSSHGKDEYPFLILNQGISILPVTSLAMKGFVSDDFVSTGIDGLDEMLNGKGYYRGSTILISGGAGTGKSSVAACMALNTCKKGGRSLLLSFEEPAYQIVRNLRSIGLPLEAEVLKGCLRIETIRPSTFGLEEHLVRIHSMIGELPARDGRTGPGNHLHFPRGPDGNQVPTYPAHRLPERKGCQLRLNQPDSGLRS